MGGSESKETFDVNLVDQCFLHQIGSKNCVRERLKRKVEKSLFQKKGLSPFENLPDELFEKITFLLAPSQVILLASCSSWFCGRLLLNRLENKFRPSSWSFLSHEYYLTKLQAQQKSVDSSSSPSTSLCWCQLPNCEEIKYPKYTLYLIGGGSFQNSYFVGSKDFYEFNVRWNKWYQLPDCPIAAPGLQLRDERGEVGRWKRFHERNKGLLSFFFLFEGVKRRVCRRGCSNERLIEDFSGKNSHHSEDSSN